MATFPAESEGRRRRDNSGVNSPTEKDIAHRLSTSRNDVVILYMDNGNIKEVGGHGALMARRGKYAEPENSQFG